MASLAAFSLTGTALALYYYSNTSSAKRKNSNVPSPSIIDTHLSLYRAPTSFFEDLYFFVEGLRFFYGETLFKWKTADLLFGLYYLCQSNGAMSVTQLSDVGQAGTVFGLEAVAAGDEERVRENTLFLQRMDRCFRYNSCLRERRPMYRKRRILQKMNIDERDFLKQATSAGVLKPSYVLVRDHELRNIVLMVRGTHSVKDAFTSLTGASKPHHVVDSNGVTLGYSHFGMLAAARWLKGELEGAFEEALRDTPGYGPLIIGHSLGGGAAAILTMMLREQGGVFQDARCLAIACPACMTMELAESCKGYVTSVVNGCDAIPMMSSGSADCLREEVMKSEWYEEFHRDMRQYKLFRAFESTKRWVRVKRETMSSMGQNVCAGDQGALVAGLERARGFINFMNGWLSANSWCSRVDPITVSEGDVNENDVDDVVDERAPSFLMHARGNGNDSESLEAEASWRRRAVEEAVLDAEAYELAERERNRAANGGNGRNAEPYVPSIIRPGNYGGDDVLFDGVGGGPRGNAGMSPPSSSPSRSWKRFMYPAGRIMHFVPAQAVPGWEDSVIEDEEPFVESPVEDDEDNDKDGENRLDRFGDRPSTSATKTSVMPPISIDRQPSELGFESVMGTEGAMLHTRTLSEAISDGPLPPLKPAPGPPPKNMLLVDNVPQSLYGRMRPSTTILADHVIPNYMRSLHSFRNRHWF